MYRRLVFLPFLLGILSLSCSQFSDLASEINAAQPTNIVDSTVIPQSFPTPEIDLPTMSTPVPISPLPTATQPLIQETELPLDGAEMDQEEVIYKLLPGSPAAMENIFHPELGCNWMGVGGQVLGESGQPVGMLVAEVGGILQGDEIEALTLTGSASHWGPGGFEFNLAEKPTLSTGSLWVQIKDLEGFPLSRKVYFDTFDNCEKAAILVNFVHISAEVVEQIYLPMIQQGQ